MIFPKKILNISVIAVSIGLLVFFFFFNKRSESSLDVPLQNSSFDVEKELEAIPVRVVPVQRSNLIMKLRSYGEAVTYRKIVLKAEVAGIIKTLNVEEGKFVKKGELLVRIEDKEFRLELKRAEALRLKCLSELFLEKKFGTTEKELSPRDWENINRAYKEYEKAKHLKARNLISKEEYEKAKMNYEFILIETGRKKEEIRAAPLTQAEIDTEIARLRLEKTKIKAPFSGVVTEIRVCPQEFIGVGKELFELVDIHRIKVEAIVLESEINNLKLGQEVSLKFNAYPGKAFEGRIKAISPIVNPEEKTCKVIIDLTSPNEEIKPGMHAKVEIATQIYRDRLIIPQEAVLVRGGRKLAFVVEDGLAKWRYIEVGLENKDYVEVLDSMSEGEMVIIEGHFTLAHDTRVRIVHQHP